MVERGHQAGVLGAQHAVAEHVAGHVADADGGEVLGLAVDAALAEVTLDRDPGAAGGDAHRLVVVPDGAAAGERVTQPEAVVLGDPVGDVGEGRGALVGRNDEVGVVTVVPDHTHRRHRLAVDEVVGDVEQAGDERLVAGDPLGQPRVPVARVGQLLAEEPALRADRHDHGVLDHLRLHQAQDLGAEVVAAVGPAQAPAGDGAEPQVHALDPRGVDEDLVLRPWLRQVRDDRRLHLEGHVGVHAVAIGGLEVVGAQGGLDVGHVGPQDAVLVEAGHAVERLGEPALDLVDLGDPCLVARVQAALARVEPGLEQLHQQPGDVHVVAQRVLDVVERERGVPLAHVLGVGAQHGRLPPGQAGAEHERVEPVDLVVAVPDGAERVLEQLAGQRRDGPAVPQAELVDERRPAQALELVRTLVDDLDAHRREHRQDLGEGQGGPDPEHLQPGLATSGVHLLVERQVDPLGLGGGAERL